MQINGRPSAVHSAELLLHFRGGAMKVQKVNFEPYGVMYEDFVEEIFNTNRKLSSTK